MALNDAVPSSATDVFKRNAEDVDRLLNSSGPVINRLGTPLASWEQITQSHASWNNRGAWATATAYAINDIWQDGANWYVVLSAYTSGATAAADIAGPNVVVLSGNFVQGVEGLGFDEFAANKNLVYPVGSVEDLAGLVGVLDDQQISLKGWHPDSDVGGGTLYWDAAKPKSEHNGGTVFSPTVPFSATIGDYLSGAGETDGTGVGCWARKSASIYVEMFGASPTLADNKPSIQSAVDFAATNGLGKVYVSALLYETKSPIVVDDNVMMVGVVSDRAGAGGSKIDNTGTGNCMTYSNTKAIYDAGIYNISLASTTGNALDIKYGAVRCDFKSCRLYTRATNKSCVAGLYTTGTVGVDWIGTYSCNFESNEYIVDYVTRSAPIIDFVAKSTAVNENEFNNLWVSQSKGFHAIRLAASVTGVYLTNNRFRGINFEKCSGGGIVMQGTSHTTLENMSFWDTADGYDGALIAIDPATSVYANKGLLIKNVARIGNSLNGAAKDISLGNSVDTTIINHSSQGSAAAIIDCNNKRSVIIGDTNASVINDSSTTYLSGGEVKARTLLTSGGGVVRDSGSDVELHSEGFNARLSSTVGGNNATVSVSGNTFYSSGGALLPNSDNTLNLGHTTNRYKNIYAGNAAISTSDEREKTLITTLTSSEKKAALEIKNTIGKFKFKESIAKKGEDDARVHVGVGAQTIINILRENNLSPLDYSFVCYDDWGRLDNLNIAKGNRYGIRYSELLCFIIAAL